MAETLHASCVATAGRAALIIGRSGAGKSNLALRMMAHGARLVSDDRTIVGRRGPDVIAWAPEPILGRIEARGVGLLPARPAPPSTVAVVVDLDATAAERLPDPARVALLGLPLPWIAAAGLRHVDAIALQILRDGPPMSL